MSTAAVPIIVNARAGRGVGDELIEAVSAHARLLDVATVVHRPADSVEARQTIRALAAEHERIVVAGGDGMIHLAANELAHSGVALGILPQGTGNDIAGALGLSRHLSAQVTTALTASPRAIDTIVITTTADRGSATPAPPHDGAVVRGVSVATLGFSVTVNERAEQLRWPTGQWSYTVASMLELPRARPVRLDLVIDGDATAIDATLVAVANTPRFGGGMVVAPGAEPDDGLLDVVVIGAAPLRELVQLLASARSGKHVNHPQVTVARGRRVEIAAANGEAVPVRADGEPLGSAPVVLELDPGSLLVCAPHAAH